MAECTLDICLKVRKRNTHFGGTSFFKNSERWRVEIRPPPTKKFNQKLRVNWQGVSEQLSEETRPKQSPPSSCHSPSVLAATNNNHFRGNETGKLRYTQVNVAQWERGKICIEIPSWTRCILHARSFPLLHVISRSSISIRSMSFLQRAWVSFEMLLVRWSVGVFSSWHFRTIIVTRALNIYCDIYY